jgi:hypothetical protein
VDEAPEVTFYILSEPALSAPEPEDWNIWQEAAHLRTENLRWRECLTAIVQELDRHHASADILREAIDAHVKRLGVQLAELRRLQGGGSKTLRDADSADPTPPSRTNSDQTDSETVQ